jgi:UDP-N-acetylglucosamine 2-epimerase (non-hydrolysing)
VTLREETEWTETVEAAGNILAGAAPAAIRAAVRTWEHRLAGGSPDFAAAASTSFGDGRAADRIVQALVAASHGTAQPGPASGETAAVNTTEGAQC